MKMRPSASLPVGAISQMFRPMAIPIHPMSYRRQAEDDKIGIYSKAMLFNRGRRNVCRVTAASHDNSADARMVVTRVYGVPAPIEKEFEPGAEILLPSDRRVTVILHDQMLRERLLYA
jgi:hypothetical protein